MPLHSLRLAALQVRRSMGYRDTMKQRVRKFWGTIATVIFLVTYCLLAMAVGGMWIAGRGLAYELPFYVVAGLLWLPAEMSIIKWMSRPD